MSVQRFEIGWAAYKIQKRIRKLLFVYLNTSIIQQHQFLSTFRNQQNKIEI